MPRLLKTVDQIARENKQNILFVDFTTPTQRESVFPIDHDRQSREDFLKWLSTEVPNVEAIEAYPPLDSGTILYSYNGTLAFILSETDQPKEFKAIVDHWESADGTPKNPNVRLFIVPSDYPESK